MSEDRLRAAVIGCGFIGQRHAQAIARSEHAVVAAVMDVDAGRAEAVARSTGARAYSDLDALLYDEPLDVVTIATPDHLHVEPAVKALAHCPVFCEKPLAMTLTDARSIVAAAESHGRALGVDYNRRFGFGYRKAKELLSAWRIGAVRHAVLRVTDGIPAFVRGRGPYALISSLLTHHIDLLRWFCGEIESVYARCGSPDDEGKFCDVVLSFQFADGALGTLLGGWRAGQTRTIEWMEVGGTHGALQVEDVQKRVRVHGLGPDTAEEFQPNYFWGEDTAFYDSLDAHLLAFLAAIRRGDPPPVAGREGVRGLEIVEAAVESHRSGQSVAV